MIEIAEARRLVLEQCQLLAPRSVLLAETLGLTLAESITSTVDSPPHNKAMMDGYALIAADLVDGRAELRVIEEVAAGAVPARSVSAGEATRIMTGAPLPTGADCVVMVERTENVGTPGKDEQVRINDPSLNAGANILPQGTCLQIDQTVLEPGHVIRGIEVGLLAEIGKTNVLVTPRPRVAMLSTGDELVPSDQSPGPGQIRNSNSPMLAALVSAVGGEPVDLGIARDNHDDLKRSIAAGLQHDMLLLSGGVSAGKFDLTPQVLDELGVEQVFHKVNLKPGKPLWFGVLRRDDRTTLVFGLPGNPVSSFVCFELFARAAIAAVAGHESQAIAVESAALVDDFQYNSGRPIHHPAVCRHDAGSLVVEILPWKGSADMLTVCRANCLASLPAGKHRWEPGQRIEIMRF